jgi:hypothetical protein
VTHKKLSCLVLIFLSHPSKENSPIESFGGQIDKKVYFFFFLHLHRGEKVIASKKGVRGVKEMMAQKNKPRNKWQVPWAVGAKVDT